jgi:hypothetical protein
MQFQKDLAPPASSTPLTAAVAAEPEAHERSAFSRALAAVEAHRSKVSMALGAAMVARLLFEFQFVSLLLSSENLIVQVPYIGLALLSYLLVLLWLSARTRDRFGFGMALGIGVIEATYLLVVAVMHRPFSVAAVWAPVVVALAHVPMAIFALQAAAAYPPRDSKRPWLVGFITALVFLAIPWLAPTVIDAFQ